MDLITLAKLWMVVKPIKRIRNARRRKRGKPALPENDVAEQVTMTLPDGQVLQRAEPLIPARTSTKLAAGGFVVLMPVIQAIQEIEFPWPWLNAFIDTDAFVQIATLIGAYLIARYSKSPAAPSLL